MPPLAESGTKPGWRDWCQSQWALKVEVVDGAVGDEPVGHLAGELVGGGVEVAVLLGPAGEGSADLGVGVGAPFAGFDGLRCGLGR